MTNFLINVNATSNGTAKTSTGTQSRPNGERKSIFSKF